MDRIEQLRIFTRVVDYASFTRAADSLNLPRSSVSAAIQQLEARVGARLIQRTTRRVAPTQEGSLFYTRCQRLIGDFEETESLFQTRADSLTGTVRINVPGRIGRRIIAPALPDFFARHPTLALELGVTDRAVDLIEEEADCVVRVGPLADSSLIARKLGELELINCASPAYLDAHGRPETPAGLSGHLSVHYASPSTGRVETFDYVEAGAVHGVALPGKVTVDNAEAYIACCLAGLGLIQIPAFDVREHLASGALEEVLPAHRAEPLPMAILYPHRRQLSRRVQACVDWLAALLKAKALAPEELPGANPPVS